ncbi:host attachment protein [Sulfurimonas sp. HSL1-2]|uniref:host attachment protein n=1 Tax=Thiomicrolovo zhangzhouensis TaxID=3131933 RepID=UPI0031F91A87
MYANGTIVVVADLGRLKAYRVVVTEGNDPHETMQVSHANPMDTKTTAVHLELLTERDYVDARHPVSESMSDKPGRFDVSTGEPHNMLLEKDRRGLEAVADDINALITDAAPETWCLAFPKETNGQLTALLDTRIVDTLACNLAKNLAQTPKEELLSHFA